MTNKPDSVKIVLILKNVLVTEYKWNIDFTLDYNIFLNIFNFENLD